MSLSIIKIIKKFVVFVIFAILSFPLFYFVYKFGEVEPIAHDFFQYYRLCHNWDWSNVNAPFNMRLISSFFIYLMDQMGGCYQTVTAFDKYQAYGFLKYVFFNAVLFNYLSVVITSTLIYGLVNREVKNNSIAFVSGLIYLLGFGTIFYHLMPGVDAFSTTLFTLFLIQYLKKNYLVLPILVALIFQREYILLAIALITLLDYVKFKDKYYFVIFILSLLCFCIYFILRRTFFYTPALSFQTDFNSLGSSFVSFNTPLIPFIKQSLMTMNLYFIYLGIVAYKFYKKIPLNQFEFWKQIFLLIQVVLLSLAASLGNNNGRYLYMLVPLLILQIMREGDFIFEKKLNNF